MVFSKEQSVAQNNGECLESLLDDPVGACHLQVCAYSGRPGVLRCSVSVHTQKSTLIRKNKYQREDDIDYMKSDLS